MATLKNCSIYSLQDVEVTLTYEPEEKKSTTIKISEKGGGRISISYAGDLASHTVTATGFVVINKLRSPSGTCSIEVPVNSDADKELRKWVDFIESKSNSLFASGSLTLNDKMAKRKTVLNNVVCQKRPDESYDQTSANRQYQLLFASADITNT